MFRLNNYWYSISYDIISFFSILRIYKSYTVKPALQCTLM